MIIACQTYMYFLLCPHSDMFNVKRDPYVKVTFMLETMIFHILIKPHI